MSTDIFGIEPLVSLRASNTQQYDFILVSKGAATPAMEMIHSVTPDPEDEDLVLIKLVNQQTLRINGYWEVQIARKGVNQNLS